MQTKIEGSKLVSIHSDDIKEGVFNCPEAVKSIKEHAFAPYRNLITVFNLNKVKCIEPHTCSNFSNLTTVIAPEVQILNLGAFAYCPKLTRVDLPKVTVMNIYAFSQCTSLTIVNAPELEKVLSHVFTRCEKLVTLNLSKVKFLDLSSFWRCNQLTTLILHPAVKIDCSNRQVSDDDFNCKNLKQIIIHNLDGTPFDKSAFIDQLPFHLKTRTITLASEIVERLRYTKKYLKQHVALEDVERQISAFYPQLLFSPKTAQESSKFEEKSSSSYQP